MVEFLWFLDSIEGGRVLDVKGANLKKIMYKKSKTIYFSISNNITVPSANTCWDEPTNEFVRLYVFAESHLIEYIPIPHLLSFPNLRSNSSCYS